MVRVYVVKFNSAVGGLLEKLNDFGSTVSYIAKVRGNEVVISLVAPVHMIGFVEDVIKDYV